jgi:RNA polymerase sigma-70 factor (ECF subfamily)
VNLDREFESNRRALLAFAARILGNRWDAEDAVQDAYLRWRAADRSAVANPAAFLITVVSRLCIDHLRSARLRREVYPGSRLPEPLASEGLGPLETVELHETLSHRTLLLMQRLSPPERAVFILREAFALPYGEIAAVVGVSRAGCRQLRHRAQERLARDVDRFPADPIAHAELLEAFLAAARNGDLAVLSRLLTGGVTAPAVDGGTRAA